MKINRKNDFFEAHEIEKTDHLITAWDTFTRETPGQSRRYDYNGKNVF